MKRLSDNAVLWEITRATTQAGRIIEQLADLAITTSRTVATTDDQRQRMINDADQLMHWIEAILAASETDADELRTEYRQERAERDTKKAKDEPSERTPQEGR